jgi:CheY-like chemotaxis protein
MLTARLERPKTAVLVVEDSPEVQRYLRTLLELDSYQTEVASNGEEALQCLQQGYDPAVVLLDMQMPGMDGLQTLQRLRELRPDLKVIMCSGVDDPEKIGQAAALGAHGYLIKPVQHLYLSAAVERCLAGEGADEPKTQVRARVVTLPVRDPLRPN